MEGKQMQMGCKFHPSLISRQRKMISECCHFKTAMLAPLICVVMFLQFGECKSRIEPAEPAISEASTSKTTKLLPDSGKLVGQQYINYFFRFTYGVPGGLEIVPLQNNPAASRLFDRKNSFALLLARSGFSPSDPHIPSQSLRLVATRAEALWGSQWRNKTAADFLRNLSKTKHLESQSEPRRVVIRGHVFYALESKSEHPLAYEMNMCTMAKGFVVSFIFEADNQQKLRQLEGSMTKLRFD